MTTTRDAFKPEGFDPKSQGGSRAESSILLAVFTAVFLLMPLCAVAQETVKAEEFSATVRQAWELLNEEKYREAASICHDATRLTSKDSELCLMVLAISYNGTGHHKKAIEVSRQLTNSTKDPTGLAMAFRELGVGLTKRLKNRKEIWPMVKPSKKFLDQLLEAEMAFRKSLDMNSDENGFVHLALVDVLVAEMIYSKGWQHGEEIKELAKFFLARNPSGRQADWAREVACLSDRYLDLESDEEDAPATDESAKEDTVPVYVRGNVTHPEKIYMPAPQYTERARRARLQGLVVIQIVIDKNGNVGAVTVLKGLPLCLSEEAVLAAKKWRFKPALMSGKPVDVYYNMDVNFSLP